MNKKQEILKLFYEQNIKGTDIANIIHVSKSYISQVIKTDSRYENKKKEQKENTIIRKREYTKQKMKEIREIKAQQDAFIKQQHLQAK